MPGPHPLLVHAALIFVSLLFGVNFVGMKLILAELEPGAWAMYRVAGATLLLVPLSLVIAKRRQLPDTRTMLWLVPAAILGVGANQLLFVMGLKLTTPAHSSVITATIPILTLIAAVVARQERMHLGRTLGIALACLGVLTLFRADELLAGAGGAIDDDVLAGDLLTVANASGYAIYLVMMRRLGRRIEAPIATAICFGYSTLFVLPFGLSAFQSANVATLVAPNILPWALYAIVGSTALTYLLNVWALRHTNSSQVALYIYIQPVVATSLSFALGQDRPGPRFFLAAGLVFAGLMADTLPQLVRARRARFAVASE